MLDSNSADLQPIISRNMMGRAVCDALKAFVGRGRDFSVKQLANRSGVKDRLIEAAMYEPEHEEWRRLSSECLVSISAVLGPDFTSDWLGLAQQAAYTLPSEEGPPPAVIAADNADDNATVTRAALDGTFDDNKPELRVVSTRMIARGMLLRKVAA